MTKILFDGYLTEPHNLFMLFVYNCFCYSMLSAIFLFDGYLTENNMQPIISHDPGFKDDSVKINVEQIFKLMSPHTEVKTI
jgi:hypothetical protein